jgi:hypothetical protein
LASAITTGEGVLVLRTTSGTTITATHVMVQSNGGSAASSGGIVDRVVQLSSGEREVHYLGVNWRHHIFVNQIVTVVGANEPRALLAWQPFLWVWRGISFADDADTLPLTPE